MKKRMTSLFLALALCLGLLPLSALAAAEGAPDKLYVGNQVLPVGRDSYWTTSTDGKLITCEATNDWNVAYDADSTTLTLKNATIKGVVNAENIASAGIYAASSSGPVSLNIVLEGENKVSGVSGIYVFSDSGDASLSISGTGSLTAEGTGYGNYSGIMVQSNGGKAELTINNVDVTATNSNTQGIRLQPAGTSPATLAVNGGSLTASGSKGIDYQFGTGTTGSGKPTVTVSNNAIVRANGSAGGITSNSSAEVQYGTGSSTTGGIVFDGNTGTVYGSVTLQEDLEIGEGESLTIGQDASLTVSNGTTLTNNGTVTTEEGGTVTNNGKIDNSGTLPETIEGNQPPKITTESLNDGEVDKNYSLALASDNNPTNWSITSGSLPGGLTLNKSTGEISGTPTSAGASTFTVTATNDSGSDSKQFSLTIDPKQTVSVTGVTLDQAELSLYTGKTATLTATVTPENATNKAVTWKSSDDTIATVDNNGKVTAVKEGTATITATAADGSGKSATCTVTVEKPYTPPPYIPPTYAVTVPETTGGTVTVSPSRASSGRRVTITATPDTGYELESLTVLDSRGSEIALTDQGDGKYTFTMPSRKVTVQASFAPVPLPFEDVLPGAWYEEAVRYAYFHNIMEGMSETEFAPATALTRAMAVQVLYNLEGQPVVSESSTFPDLVYEWYKPAIAWAESTGVVDGYEDGTFQPDQPVTRQEFAQMLYNYAKYKGHDLTAEGDLSAFPDGDSVQEWALSAMSWANGNGLINGHDDGTLEPGGTTTRAQAASILMRFDQNLAE